LSIADFSVLSWLMNWLLKRKAAPKVVVFCRRFSDCVNLYELIKKKLGTNLTDPPRLQNALHVRFVDMFIAASKPEVRKIVVFKARY